MNDQETRVLVLVAQAELRACLLEHLHLSGYSAAAASDAAGLWAMLKHGQSHNAIILLDEWLTADAVDSQDMPGIHLIAELTQHYPSSEILFLLSEDSSAGVTALKAGAAHYLRCPIVIEELNILIERASARQWQRNVCGDNPKQIAQALRKAEQRARNLRAIHEVAVAISGLQELNDILAATCRAVCSLFDVDHSAFALFDEAYLHGKVVAEYPDRGTQGVTIPLQGVELEERLIATKEPLIIADVAAAANLGELGVLWARFDIRSILIVPLVFKGRVLGSFSLDAIGRIHSFSAEELDLCTIFAAEVAAAVGHAHLLAESKQWADQLETLRRTSLALTSQRERTTLLQTILHHAVTLLQAKSGGIYEYDPQQGELTIIADYQRAAMAGKTLRLGEGMAGYLVQYQLPYLIVDDYDASSFHAPVYQRPRPFRAVIEVPLRWNDLILGVLYIDDNFGRKFTERDAHLLRLFADQAAIALENARLLANDQAKLRLLERMAQASREIMGNPGGWTLAERLDRIARHATEILDAEACSILLVKRPGFLSLEASYGHQEGMFQKGREFAIVSGVGSGLTGHIASLGELFNAHGPALTNHVATTSNEPLHIPTGACHSLLAIPLKKRRGDSDQLIGLLRVDNKKDHHGHTGAGIGFSQEDEWILQLFADNVVVAIESAALVDMLREQTGHWERLIASAPDGIIAIDTHGIVTNINPRAQQVLKGTPELFLGQHVDRIYAEEGEAQRIGAQLRAAADGKLVHHATFLRSTQDERIPIRLDATLLYNAAGEQVGSVGYFEDLRAIQEMENRLDLLVKATTVVAGSRNLAEGLQRLAEMIVSYLRTTFCRIFLLDESQQCLVTTAAAATQRVDPQMTWQLGQNGQIVLDSWPDLAALVYAKTPQLLRADQPEYQPLLAAWTRGLALDNSVQLLLLIPLCTQERIVGLLELGDVRQWERSPFTDERLQLAAAIADHTVMLIERLRLYELSERDRQLLTALDETSRHIRAERETGRILQAVVRLAAELVNCSCGGLYMYRPQLEELELHVVYELPDSLLGQVQPVSLGLLGAVARSGRARIVANYATHAEAEALLQPLGFQMLAAVPLRGSDGAVEAVLFVADRQGSGIVSRSALEILERFAAQASIALQTSRLINSEQRMFGRIALLQRLSDYMQNTRDEEQIFHALLMGVTAGYGLGFNRAAILLCDPTQDTLLGRMGIGHLEHAEARAAWRRDQQQELYSFDVYLRQLEQAPFPPTPVDTQIRRLRLPLRSADSDGFFRVVDDRHARRVDDLAELPHAFVAAFEPELPLVIIPLMNRDQVIGLLVADNKFTRAPISQEDLEALLTFANTASIAIANQRLLQQAQASREQLMALYAASNALISAEAPDIVLQEIVEQTHRAAQANWVRLLLLNEQGQACQIFAAGINTPLEPAQAIRPHGIAAQVIHSGKEVVISDISQQHNRLNPRLFPAPHGATLCLPLLLHGRALGVMWLFYEQLRHFPPAELEALRLYVNQAALAYDKARWIEELDHMRQTVEALAAAATLADVRKQIVRSACDVLGANSAVLWSYDALRERFIPASSETFGLPAQCWEEFLQDGPRRDGTTFTLMDHDWTDEVQDINDLQRYDCLHEPTRTLLQKSSVCSFLIIPLRVGSERLGILYANYHQPRNFRTEERQTAQTFADHAALALNKARLLEQLRKARNTAQLVAKVTALGKLDDTLRSLAEGMRDVVGCDVVTVYVYDQENNRFSHPPTVIGARYPERTQRFSQVPHDSVVFAMLCRNDLYIVEDTASDLIFRERRFTKDEEIVACVVIPLQVGTERVGVMFVNYRSVHRLTSDEQTNIELFANQAAVAIRNAQFYEQVQRRAQALEALYEAGQAVTSSLELQEILDRIVEQAWRLTSYRETPISFANIRLVSDDRAKFVAAFPKEKLEQVRAALGDAVDLRTGKDGRIGIMGRTILTGKPCLVADVSKDPDYLATNSDTRSELAVPILDDGQVIGVINVEHPDYAAFDLEDQRTLEALAAQAAIAIRNVRQYTELKRTKGLVGARTALAWMGMANSTWRHSIEGSAINIRNAVGLLRRDLNGVIEEVADKTKITRKLDLIERNASRILEKPITPPLSSEEGVEELPINDLLQERIRQLQQNDDYQHIDIQLHLEASADISVQISPEWLRRALDLLVDNAVEAMRHCPQQRLDIRTQIVLDKVEIALADTGKGIPPPVQAKLLQERIEKSSDEPGLGMGLLMVQAIVQTYGGDIQVKETGPTGTTMLISLPIAHRHKG